MSKIAAVKTYPIIAKLKNVQRTAQESRGDVELLLVEVVTEDGLTGYGQITSTPMPEIKKWVDRFGEEVRGMDALARVGVWERTRVGRWMRVMTFAIRNVSPQRLLLFKT